MTTITDNRPLVADVEHNNQAMRADGTARYGFHASPEHNGQYIIYPKGRRERAQVYKTWMIERDGRKCGPTFANGSEINALGDSLFG